MKLKTQIQYKLLVWHSFLNTLKNKPTKKTTFQIASNLDMLAQKKQANS